MGRLRSTFEGIPDVMWVTGLVASLGLAAIALLVMTSVALAQRPAKPERAVVFDVNLTMTPIVETPVATPTVTLVVADATPSPRVSPTVAPVGPEPTPAQAVPDPTPTPLPAVAVAPPAPPTPTKTPAETKMGVINSPAGQRAMLRAGPSRNDAIVGRIPPGTEVGIVTATSGEEIEPGENRWFQIRWQTVVGYVYAPLVTPR
jgi:hypothetical protein